MSEIPVFSIHDVERRRDKWFQQVLLPRIGHSLVGDVLDHLAFDLWRVLPKGATRDASYEMVRSFGGQVLTERKALEFAWRLAGNVERLKAGEIVSPWTAQQGFEWMPLQVLRAYGTKNRHNKIGYMYVFRVLAGSAAPMLVKMFWTSRQAKYASARMGFTAGRGVYRFRDPLQLVGLRLLAQFDPVASRSEPVFREINESDNLVKWNREHVLKLRFRVNTACPNGWTHDCHRCAVGYENCVGGTHRFDFTMESCPDCGNEQAIFDPEESTTSCANCVRKVRLTQVKK